jgi:hypothetical protein
LDIQQLLIIGSKVGELLRKSPIFVTKTGCHVRVYFPKKVIHTNGRNYSDDKETLDYPLSIRGPLQEISAMVSQSLILGMNTSQPLREILFGVLKVLVFRAKSLYKCTSLLIQASEISNLSVCRGDLSGGDQSWFGLKMDEQSADTGANLKVGGRYKGKGASGWHLRFE